MENIAKTAKINKAMIFYYYSSKELLHQEVVREMFEKMSPLFGQLVLSNPSPAQFLEEICGIYTQLFAREPDFVKMIALELIQNPQTIIMTMKELFRQKELPGPPHLVQLLRQWKEEKRIVEEDPLQFMMNVVSLSLLSFLIRPFLEAIFNVDPGKEASSQNFVKKRLESVVGLLKRGMLK